MRHSSQEVIAANIALHTQLAGRYRESEPHYLPENVRHVDGILRSLRSEAPGGDLLDLGCGAGFIIDIAKRHFSSIEGIDVTPAMLDLVILDSDSCRINVQVAQVEAVPFQDRSFDAVTAYALLHHLAELGPTFREVHRVLRPGGVFYSDLDPNFYFWEAFNNLDESAARSDFVRRELYAVQHKDQELLAEFGVDPKLLGVAETLKHEEGGFKEEDLTRMLHEAGFSAVSIRYFWFLGEAKVLHGEDPGAAGAIRDHLVQMLPLSRHLFKYVGIWARK